ncbi:hypothetical protein ABW19_dt0202253 [Dactylella cylindrospora]|nr:hypothetical protein ABW19_dt0202253 [Dactylella cylindrospora]
MAEEGGSSNIHTTEAEKADMKTAQELADLERLSQNYQPDTNGPLVGPLQSSKILEAEYANADQVYVRKTAALSPKYSNYRTIRGDGNCGWRALAFGYFELVLRSGDASFIQTEMGRIKSMCNYMDSVGMSEYLYEDFVEETLKVFSDISQSPAIDAPYDDSPLLAAFNDDDRSNAIITHLKLLISAYMKVNPAPYEAFLETTVFQYCSAFIEPYAVEIDHIGINAFVDLIILPAGFEVEISYLDRSETDEVNVHKFEKDDGTPSDGGEKPTLRLLYRPGHYDMIYKNGDLAPSTIPTSSAPQNVQVSMMYGQQYACNPFLTPFPFPSSGSSADFGAGDLYGQSYPSLRVYRSHDGMISTLKKPCEVEGVDASTAESASSESPDGDGKLQTRLFKDSHYNTCHFQNENFQPEMWNPED